MPYKICQQIGTKFYSCSVPKQRGRRQYHIGKPTRKLKNAGPLTAFRTLRDVKLFLRCNNNFPSNIVICKVSIRTFTGKPHLWVPATHPELSEMRFPSYDKLRDARFIRWRLPQGTILCSSITLTFIVYRIVKDAANYYHLIPYL